MNCEHCGKVFSTKPNLVRHQKGAKYCMHLKNGTEKVKHIFTCIYCSNSLSSKQMLNKHLDICLEKYKFLIEKKDRELVDKDKIISALEAKLELYEKQETRAYNTVERIANKHSFEEETTIDIETGDVDNEEYIDIPYELVPLEIDEGYIIEHREEDGYINVTNLCKAGGKKFASWKRLDRTTEFLNELSIAVQIHTTKLLDIKQSGNAKEQGTWVHPQVAINIAQWISPKFDIKVSAWIYEVMMTGKVDISNTTSYRQLQTENKDKQLRIKFLEKKYMKKQPREIIKDKNVMYILTTKLLKKENRYILGIATDLTNRLSTYNKTDEHQIVYYQSCPDEENMSVVENMVFKKLKDYREQANRERFILPEGENINLFIDTIKHCIDFIG